MLKVTDDYQNQRLTRLMEAMANDRLEDEVCPNCFELYSVPILRQFNLPVLVPKNVEGSDKVTIQEAVSQLKNVKAQSLLKKDKSGDELVNEYICQRCHRKYIGELDLVASQAETKVLSFFGYDTSRMYEKDFYSFSLLDDSYSSFVSELWDRSVFTSFTPHSMTYDIEDVITGKVLAQLEAFFREFVKVIYDDIGATVKIYTEAHAGTKEAGRGTGMPPSGADFAMWVGPLTREDAEKLEAYKAGKILAEELPIRVGNGAIFQAKKAGGSMDKEQIEDLVAYASIRYKEHDYFGIPGKLFMNYFPAPPFVTILSCDYTYALYSGDLLKDQKTVSFPKTLKVLSKVANESPLPDFVNNYLSGKAGTPLLMLQDVFGTPGPKLIVGLPPELLRTSSPAGQTLSGILDEWCCAFDQRLGEIEQEEQDQAALLRHEEARRRAEHEESLRRQQAQRVVLKQMH
jgi:hypothetical protein